MILYSGFYERLNRLRRKRTARDRQSRCGHHLIVDRRPGFVSSTRLRPTAAVGFQLIRRLVVSGDISVNLIETGMHFFSYGSETKWSQSVLIRRRRDPTASPAFRNRTARLSGAGVADESKRGKQGPKKSRQIICKLTLCRRKKMTTRETVEGYFSNLKQKKAWDSFLSDQMSRLRQNECYRKGTSSSETQY
jgi:hypothetical protein